MSSLLSYARALLTLSVVKILEDGDAERSILAEGQRTSRKVGQRNGRQSQGTEERAHHLVDLGLSTMDQLSRWKRGAARSTRRPSAEPLETRSSSLYLSPDRAPAPRTVAHVRTPSQQSPDALSVVPMQRCLRLCLERLTRSKDRRLQQRLRSLEHRLQSWRQEQHVAYSADSAVGCRSGSQRWERSQRPSTICSAPGTCHCRSVGWIRSLRVLSWHFFPRLLEDEFCPFAPS